MKNQGRAVNTFNVIYCRIYCRIFNEGKSRIITISSVLSAASHLHHIFHFSLRRFRRAEAFPYIIIITATTDPFTSDGRDESNFFTGRQSCDYICTLLRKYNRYVLALERDLSEEKKKERKSRMRQQFTHHINHCNDLRQHLEHDNCCIAELLKNIFIQGRRIY